METISYFIWEQVFPKIKLLGAYTTVYVKSAFYKVYGFFWQITDEGIESLQEDLFQHIRHDPWFQAIVILCTIYLIYRLVYVPFFQDYLIAERCRFYLESPMPLKVGDSIVYTITGFLTPSMISASQVDATKHKFFNALTTTVTLNDERISALKAYADDNHGEIKIFFPADKSGTYKLDVRYNGFIIPGSPHEVIVPPDFMSAVDTELNLPSMPVILTDGMPQTIEIYPRDRTGHPCSAEGVRLDKFDFHASEERPCCCAAFCGKQLELIGATWREGLDARFSYDGSPFGADRKEKSITILLHLRTHRTCDSHGIFDGQICYDGQILKNGCFPIISLASAEYEKLESVLLKDPVITDETQLKAEIIQLVRSNHVVNNNADKKEIDGGCGAEKVYSNNFIEWYGLPKGVKEISPYTFTTKEVHVNVSSKFIGISEVVWTVLLSQTALFHIQGDTKVDVVPETEEKLRYLVSISDETQKEIRLSMSPSNTRMLMALYYKYRAIPPESIETVTDTE